MSQFRSQLIREVVGPGAHTEDGVPVPKQFRQIPIENGGVPPTTPAGARQPTGSPVSTIPQPQ
jgi:hypothetical protein